MTGGFLDSFSMCASISVLHFSLFYCTRWSNKYNPLPNKQQIVLKHAIGLRLDLLSQGWAK